MRILRWRQVEKSCEYLQRGDILLPFAERPAPPLKSEISLTVRPSIGKPMAMMITGKGTFRNRLQRYRLCQSGQFAGREGRGLFPHLPLYRHEHEDGLPDEAVSRSMWMRGRECMDSEACRRNTSGITRRAKCSEKGRRAHRAEFLVRAGDIRLRETFAGDYVEIE